MRRGPSLARVWPGPSVSGSGALSRDGPLRQLLPLLHALPVGQQRQRLRFPPGIRPSNRLYPPHSRDSRCPSQRRRPAALQRREAGILITRVAEDSARGISAHWIAHPNLFAAADYTAVV